ncbi:MAG: DUF6314 family protein [Amaricoccus sp.]
MEIEAFIGGWSLTRRIEDARAGQTGRFEGHAAFRPTPEGLAYREEGWLTLGAAAAVPVRGERRYLWQAAGDRIVVRFGDGRFFHAFAALEAEPEAEHDCPPDFYRVRYDFRAWPLWRAEWRVRGPRKDHVIRSDYRPVARASHACDKDQDIDIKGTI